jgi:branched-chain amino acid transport system substrate-binding protein
MGRFARWAGFVSVVCMFPAVALAQADRPWVIGLVTPLSGPAATVGARMKKVVDMWVEEVNGAGGLAGRKVELIACNEENRPEKAVSCARDVIDKGAVMILGNSLTASIRAMLPLTRKGPVMLIPSPNVVPGPDTYAFQVSPSDEHITEALASFLKQNKFDKIGMVAATDASGEVGVSSAKSVFGRNHIELKLARIDLRATDASTQLASIASADTPIIYSSYTGAGAVTVVKSYHNLGLEQPLVVSYGNLSDAFAQLVKDVKPKRLLGTSLAALVPEMLKDPEERRHAERFNAAYKKRYNEPPDMLSVSAKAEVDVAEAILRNVGNPADAEAVKKYLYSNPVTSVHRLRFSPSTHVGLDATSIIMAELKGGVWTKADPIK